jgi:hypothetical protein
MRCDFYRVLVCISLHHEFCPERGAQPLNQLLSGLPTQLLAMDDEKRLGHEALILVAARANARPHLHSKDELHVSIARMRVYSGAQCNRPHRHR